MLYKDLQGYHHRFGGNSEFPVVKPGVLVQAEVIEDCRLGGFSNSDVLTVWSLEF